MGDLLAYLNPVLPQGQELDEDYIRLEKRKKDRISRPRRVIDREDVSPYFPGFGPVK